MLTLILGAVAGGLIAGFASAAEIATLAVPYERLKELVVGGGYRARALWALRQRPLRLLAEVWVLRIVGAALSAIAAWQIAEEAFARLPGAGPVAVVAVIALLLLIQAVSRAGGIKAPEALALTVSLPLWLLSFPLLVLIWPGELLIKALAPNAAEALPRITDREIRDLIGGGNGEPEIEEHERRLIQRAFELDQTTAYDAMTPRVDMFAWPENRMLAEIARELPMVRYSRVPLYLETIDKVTGILYVRDAYQALVSGRGDVELRVLAREPLLVPGSMTLDKLLLVFQNRRIHMGIVIDEYGGTDGLITLEDILEELVGEIVDETDVELESILRLGRHDILVDGGADLREINYFLNTTFPSLEHRSLNGYLLEALGRVPQTGERLVEGGVSIEVTEATDTQVIRARLTRLRTDDATAGPGSDPAAPKGTTVRPSPLSEEASG